jgi:transposase InsO family protein
MRSTTDSPDESNITLIAMEHGPKDSSEWVVDSGCTTHVASSTAGLTQIVEKPGEITVGGGGKLAQVGVGQLEARTKDATGAPVGVTVQGVRVVPGMGRNLLSVRQVVEQGGKAFFTPSGGFIEMQGKTLPLRQSGRLYLLDLDKRMGKQEQAYVTEEDSMLWHLRLGHRNMADIKRLGELDVGVPKGLGGADKCGTCEVSKHKLSSFPRKAAHRATQPRELVYMDVMGPFEVESHGRARYLLGLTDAATCYRWVYPMATKGKALECVERWMAELKADPRARGWRVKQIDSLRSENGGEFTGHDFKAFCRAQGVQQTFTGAYAPQQNGVAERTNRTLIEMVRSMLRYSGLAKEYWGEAANTAAYTINRLSTDVLGGDTPYHAFWGKHADLSHLKVFGCRAYVHVHDQQRRKLDDKAWEGILVGYHERNRTIYRVYDEKMGITRESVHVTFNEEELPCKKQSGMSDYAPMGMSQMERQQLTEELEVEQQQQPQQQQQQQQQQQEEQQTMAQQQAPVGAQGLEVGPGGRPMRDRRPPSYLTDDYEVNYGYAAAESVYEDPSSYAEAMASEHAPGWLAAMQRELQSLRETQTFELCERPAGKNVVGVKWVFKTKRDQAGEIIQFKARLVAQGFTQVHGLDYSETFAPVAKMTTIRLVLALAAANDWELHNMDVNTAYLNAPVDEQIYAQQPKGFEQLGPGGGELVMRLLKSLYGLKQSGHNWNRVIDDWLIKYGLEPTASDPCAYVLDSPGGEDGILVVLLWVDDLIILGSELATVIKFKQAISERFKMKDLEELSWILGMEVRRDRGKGVLEINQTAYIDQMMQRFGMADCKPVPTPMCQQLTKLDPDGLEPDKEYMRAVGSLLYASIVTRPDISFAVQSLARHLQASGEEHWMAVKRLLRYLKGTRELSIQYHADAEDPLKLKVYSDSDWGGDLYTRRSTTGYLTIMAGGPVSWTSRLQPTVALSSAEAEYMAASAATKEVMYLRQLLDDLRYPQVGATMLLVDNQGAIGLAKNPVLHQRTKHIDIRYHFIRERVKGGDVQPVYVSTNEQWADLLTKALDANRIEYLRGKVLA